MSVENWSFVLRRDVEKSKNDLSLCFNIDSTEMNLIAKQLERVNVGSPFCKSCLFIS